MSFNNSNNRSHVEKIVKSVTLLQAEARKHNPSGEAIWLMMTPALDAISELCGASTAAQAPTPPSGLTYGQRAAQVLAEQASLRDLIVALMVRLDAHAAKLKG